jgi:hypothetical protein
LRSILGQSDLGSPAVRARQDQRRAPAGHRCPDRRVGSESDQRRGTRPRTPAVDATGHGPPG